MLAHLNIAFAALLLLGAERAPERAPDGGGSYRPPRQPCLDEAERQRIRDEIERSVQELTRAGVLTDAGHRWRCR